MIPGKLPLVANFYVFPVMVHVPTFQKEVITYLISHSLK
jgi:hypothetical protein